VWVILISAGFVGLWLRFSYGETAAGYGSYVPWGIWIALYFMGVAIAGGAFVFGAAGYILGWTGFTGKANLRMAMVLSLGAILPAFMVIWLDLGRMERLFMVFTSATFTSMIAFNAWMYNSFLVLVVVCWLLSFKNESFWLKPLLCLGGFMSVLFPSQSGVFFEAIGTKEYWNSPLLSMMFLSSALTAGAASLLAIRVLFRLRGGEAGAHAAENDSAIRTLRTITVAGLVVYLAFEFAEISIAIWRPYAESRAVDFLIRGDYWWVFWIVQLFIGAVVPLVLYVLTNSRGAWALASILLILGFVAARMGILIPGQVVGQIPGLEEAFQDVRLVYSYHVSSMEYLIGALMIAVGMAAFFIGRRLSLALEAKYEQEA
ncbi:MAG: NrfD/PsrC family molybdoenzyme membrane anchor subunit, partial [Desulfomonilaceae bacterium]|nr:NrfD/PsrC family molybdoenzyme membrane anchor subunit [Desulfomonilaceae bacterium]